MTGKSGVSKEYITMTQSVTPDMTVGRLVAEQPARASVLERLGLDYCCGGNRSLTDACAAKGLDVQAVQRELEDCDAADREPEQDLTRASVTALCDHIERTHHAYLRKALPRLDTLTEKALTAHGENHPELRELRDLFRALRSELEAHLAKEEMILFPLCRQIDGAAVRPRSHCGSVANPIRVMIAEHEDAGAALVTMRALTAGFAPPPDACNTYRAMLAALSELELDLHRHIHKENNILFPKVEALEAALPIGG
jgi:regulator of cell morphogenesis and NO signaling